MFVIVKPNSPLDWHFDRRASTQNQALSALLFLYKDVLGIEVGRLDEVPRARLPIRVPVVLSRDEASSVLKQLT